MEHITLRGLNGLGSFPEPVKHRKMNPNVSQEDTIKMITRNNHDEVLFRNPQGDLIVSYADELKNSSGQMPKVGDKVTVDFVDEPLEVVHVDDEGRHALRYFNGDSPMLNDAVAVIGVVANSKLVATTDKYGQIKKGVSSTHSPYTPSVQTPQPASVTQQAPALSTPKPSPVVRREPAFVAPPLDLKKPVSESELTRASQLEKKVSNGYSLTQSEMTEYSHIFQRLEHQRSN